MGAAAEDGIEEPALETGTNNQIGGITTEKLKMNYCLGNGVAKSRLEAI